MHRKGIKKIKGNPVKSGVQGERFMTSQKIISSVKNAMGTMFLLAGAFFVCSTLVSIRAVFADPIAPMNVSEYEVPQGTRTNVRTSGRTSPRGTNSVANRATVARTSVAPVNNVRTNMTANQNRAVQSRAVSTRTNVRTNQISNQRADMTKTRNVVNRTKSTINRANANLKRNVRTRTATTEMADNARVSLQGSAIRGSKAAVSSLYSNLNNKLYTGNYSNIIDSSTGLISAEAFSNCMESYYTCMDEICTARNAAQRRCACAGRVKAFADAEAQLETANEELIKASGELALLIANKGKDISQAFQLTDAEKVMNCVSWKEMASKFSANSDRDNNGVKDDVEWCQAHGIYDSSECSSTEDPDYCRDSGNNFGFDIDNIEGSSSDILASLQAWADAKAKSQKLVEVDDNNLSSAFDNISNVVGSLSGITGSFGTTETSADKLANTWGYDLFAHAHNEVCSRVLDSCFNGIYEACGSPASFGGKCADGQSSSCPFNFNSKISVTSGGEIKLNERGTSVTTNSSATCFGYTSANGDPYSNLRGPVADARRSIMNKYLLDANADCDVYGEQLRTMAQNIGYQKVAAQQSLQQKRLEFAMEEQESILNAGQTAIANFNECLSEIWECYEETADSEPNWTSSRIKTYCAQVANVPHCYEEMICHPTGAQFVGVINLQDKEECTWSQDYTKNTCRNVVTLNEVLNGASETPVTGNLADGEKYDSAGLREACLREALGLKDQGECAAGDSECWDLRKWTKAKSSSN